MIRCPLPFPSPSPSPSSSSPTFRFASALAATLVISTACLACGAARADGLSDLKSALDRLKAQAPLKAALQIRSVERVGEGADMDEKTGQADAQVEAAGRGLGGITLGWSPETLARMDAESRQQGRDAQANTPTLRALARLDTSELPSLVSATSSIARTLDESQFKGERNDTWQGKPARVLDFALSQSRVPEQQRKYVRQFDGTLSLWIAADGTPLGSALRETVEGRAFIVVSFEVRDDEDSRYDVVGDRLVTTRKEIHKSSRGAGERGEQRLVTTLRPLP